MKTVVCTKCNWTSFAVTKEYAENEIKKFNDYFYSLTERERIELFGNKPSSIESYKCMFCGGEQFKDGNTARNGSTIGPVIYEEKK